MRNLTHAMAKLLEFWPELDSIMQTVTLYFEADSKK